MGVSIELQGVTIRVLNVHFHNSPAKRTTQLLGLSQMVGLLDTPAIVGGAFNSVLTPQMDTSNPSAKINQDAAIRNAREQEKNWMMNEALDDPFKEIQPDLIQFTRIQPHTGHLGPTGRRIYIFLVSDEILDVVVGVDHIAEGFFRITG